MHRYNPIKIVSDIYYACLARFYYKPHIVYMPGIKKWQWCEIDRRMLHANMELLVELVEKQKCFDRDYSIDAEHRRFERTVRRIYNWWKLHPKRVEEIGIASEVWHDECAKHDTGNESDDWNREQTYREKVLFNHVKRLEDKLYKEEEAMLIDLMKIRRNLWT